MERIFFWFLLIDHILNFHIVSAQSSFSASACYGSEGSCNFISLNCSSHGTIRILRADYLFYDKSECKLPGCRTRLCCDPKNGNNRTPFRNNHTLALNKECSKKKECRIRAPWTSIQGIGPSSIVEVQYECQTGGNQEGSPEGGSKDSNTAAIVAPIVVVLMIVIVAAVFFYWIRRRKQQLEKGSRKHENNLHAPVHNPGYFDADKATGSSKDVNDGDLDPENTYHTIDPNSIPVQVTANDCLVLDPEDEYNVIDPNDTDSGQVTTNEYFIIEPEGQNSDTEASQDVDYNKLNLKGNEIVKDPNYQRLAAVDQSSKDKPKEENENYSHINGDKFSAEDTENKESSENEIQVNAHHVVLNDDYSHLDNKRNF